MIYENITTLQQGDNRQRTTEGEAGIMESRIYGTTEIGFALLCRTTDYRQRTTEGEAGIRNYGTTDSRNYGIRV